MSQSDLYSRTIDLYLYGNRPIEILYQYEYVAQVERLNYGTITASLRKGSKQDYVGTRARFSRNDVT